MTRKPMVVVYTSNRYDEVLARVVGHHGLVMAVTSDLAKVMGLKVEKPARSERQCDLWGGMYVKK